MKTNPILIRWHPCLPVAGQRSSIDADTPRPTKTTKRQGTMPSGSAKILGVVRRETIQDPNFYNHFFALIEQYVAEEQRSHPDGRHAKTRDR
jgi:hypothetical protein